MKVAVWDTYVKRGDGKIMHFDIIAPDQIKDINTILEFGKEYLVFTKQGVDQLTARECKLCHIEQASHEIILSIKQKGYYIVEMENCN